jgi:hypothetical protein
LSLLGFLLHDPVPEETVICLLRLALAESGLMARLFPLLEEQLTGLC